MGPLEQPVLHGDPPASSGVLLDAAAEFPVCLVTPDDAGSAEDETEKVDVGGSINSALGFIDSELELVCQEGFHSFHYPVTGTLAVGSVLFNLSTPWSASLIRVDNLSCKMDTMVYFNDLKTTIVSR